MNENGGIYDLCIIIRLMDDGGWSILNVWLLDAKKAGNIPLLIEIIQVMIDNVIMKKNISTFMCRLQVLNKLPVTIAALKQVSH